ncbi:MAG TPA: hypothetical protein VHA52_02960 [Candidatus Babeliaceae bacterium]|nr:hypothetical protein [Candidatus Babeliaceae bacterium]
MRKVFFIALLLLTAQKSWGQFGNDFFWDYLYYLRHPPECVGLGVDMILPKGDMGEYFKGGPGIGVYMRNRISDKFKATTAVTFATLKPRVDTILDYAVEQGTKPTIYPGYTAFKNAMSIDGDFDVRYRFMHAGRWSVFAGVGFFFNLYYETLTEYMEPEAMPSTGINGVETIGWSMCADIEYRASERLNFIFDWRYNAALYCSGGGNYSHAIIGINIAYFPRVEDTYYLNY